jgi:eukaryotic-like serine/threonine-protein kinase
VSRRAAANDRLRRAREERHLTQAEVADAVGTSSFTVSRWELGVQLPQAYFREKLCALFGMGPQELGLLPDAEPAPDPGGRAESRRRANGVGWDPAESRARRDLRAQVWRFWVGTELETAVGHLPRIELTLVDCPDAVDDPLRVAGRPADARRPLKPGTAIDSAYHRAGEQLLILGDPGAGKTTMLLELTRALLDGPPSGPTPVVFHLASWAESRQPLAEWLAAELHRRYGVARRLGRAWIADEQVLPLLDGLDEVADEHRAGCADAIAGFLAEHGQLPVVVCCRTAEYEALGVKLRLRGAVLIRPLTGAQVERYLVAAGDSAAEVRALVHADARLRELLTTPLFLRMIVRTYGARATGPVTPLRGALPERRRRVLADYVDEMLSRPRAASPAPSYSPEQTLRWLAWLARSMRQHSEGVFHLDWLQPSWLPGAAQRRLVTLAPAVLMVLVGAIVGMLDVVLAGALPHGVRDLLGPSASPADRLMAALLGLAAGAVAGGLAATFTYERSIAPTSRLGWSWATFRRNLPGVLAAVLGALPISLLLDRVLAGVAAHLAYGVLLVVLFALFTRPWMRGLLFARWAPAAAGGGVVLVAVAALLSGQPAGTLVYQVAARLAVGMALGLMFGPRTPLSETVPAPGQGIAMSWRHGVNAGLLSAALAAVLFGVVAGISVALMVGSVPAGVAVGALDGLSIGAIVGFGVALRRGVGASFRHALLRWLLAAAGSAPRDYVGFLEHATSLILLRRRGGGYEFVHRMLLDHFADLEPSAPEPVRRGAGPLAGLRDAVGSATSPQ